MAYRSILTLSLAHEYYGSDAIPLQVRPADAPAFDKAGLLIRQRGNIVQVLADDAEAHPDTLSLDVLVQTPDVFVVTKGADWRNVLMFDLSLDTEALTLDPDQAQDKLPQHRAERLARLNFAMVPDAARSFDLSFEAVEALWAYHVTGGQNIEDLEVVDPKAHVSFSAQGQVILPNGQQAFVIRSDVPVPARARPDQKFTLQRPSAFGPETLVPVLPAAGISFKPIEEEQGGAARLQSDIYVSLW